MGIDLGQHLLHIVALDGSLDLTKVEVVDAADSDGLALLLSAAHVVAIDAPERLSTAPHSDEEGLSPKFRTARCAEIALGREKRIWVPWVTPTSEQPCPGWMEVGFRVFEIARRCSSNVIEVFPYAGFRTLAGSRMPSKLTAAGLLTRSELLVTAGVKIEDPEMWSHDSLDACLAALVAQQFDGGIADAIGCGHDGSAIWLPPLLGRQSSSRSSRYSM